MDIGAQRVNITHDETQPGLGFRFRLQVDQMGSRGTFEKARFILIKQP